MLIKKPKSKTDVPQVMEGGGVQVEGVPTEPAQERARPGKIRKSVDAW